MPILTIRLSTELHARFMEECGKRDINASELGRRAIENICQQMVDAGDKADYWRGEAARLEGQIRSLGPQRAISRAQPGIRGFSALSGEPITGDQQMANRAQKPEKKPKP